MITMIIIITGSATQWCTGVPLPASGLAHICQVLTELLLIHTQHLILPLRHDEFSRSRDCVSIVSELHRWALIMRQIDGLHAPIWKLQQSNYVSSNPMPVLKAVSRPKELFLLLFSLPQAQIGGKGGRESPLPIFFIPKRIYFWLLSWRGANKRIGVTVRERGTIIYINPLKKKRGLLYLKTQFVPRSKHFSSRL